MLVLIELLHHTYTGWTYSGGGGTPIGPPIVASMSTDHATEDSVIGGEHGAWKRTDIQKVIHGNDSEGLLWRVTTTSNKAFDEGTLMISVQ